MQQYTTDIMIIGGGASGLAAAVAAKRFCPELSVTILERNSRVGKKILATGNGRCNLGNISTDSRYYYGSCKKYWNTIIEQTQPAEAFFQSMGLYCRRESDGRLYPCSNQAASVLDALRLTIEQEGISDVCDCLVSYIQQNFTGKISLREFGEQFHLSEKYISRYFKEHFHITLSQYVTYLRLEHAKQLLQDTDIPVTDVAMQSGYQNVSYFIRSFQKAYAVSPLKYRKNNYSR